MCHYLTVGGHKLGALLPVEVSVDVGDGGHLLALLDQAGVQRLLVPPAQPDLLPLQHPLLVVHPEPVPHLRLVRHGRVHRLRYGGRAGLPRKIIVNL